MGTAEAVGGLEPAGRWAPPGAPDVRSRTPWELFWERFREDRVALAALGFIAFEIIVAGAAPLVVGAVAHPPNSQYPEALDPVFGTPTGPSLRFFFGVDPVGEDVFSRVLYGARVSLEVALVATALSVVIGVALGMVAGYYRGVTDTAISRVIDVTLAFPILARPRSAAPSSRPSSSTAGAPRRLPPSSERRSLNGPGDRPPAGSPFRTAATTLVEADERTERET